MKRRLKATAWVLLALLAAYSALAWVLLRGVGAYRLGTTLGRVLAATRPFALAGAVLLAVALGLGILLRRRSAAARREAEGAGKIAPAAPTELLPETGRQKIAPARPAPERPAKAPKASKKEKAAAGTGKIAPAAPARPPEPAATVLLAEEPAATERLTEKEPAATVLLTQEEPAATVLLTQEEPAATELLPEEAPAAPAAPRVCPVCGEPIRKAGQKFCVHCGAVLEGGAV